MSDITINRDILRNHIDTIVLHLLSEKDRYGYEIYKEVLARTNNEYELKEPSLYSAFRRLEKEKKIKGYWGDEAQGGRRKYYSLTSEGKNSCALALSEWVKVKDIVDKILDSNKREKS